MRRTVCLNGILTALLFMAASGTARAKHVPVPARPVLTFTGKIRSGTCNFSVVGGSVIALPERFHRGPGVTPVPLRFSYCTFGRDGTLPSGLLLESVSPTSQIKPGGRLWGEERSSGSGIELVAVHSDGHETELFPGVSELPLRFRGGAPEKNHEPLQLRGRLVKAGPHPVQITAVLFLSAIYR